MNWVLGFGLCPFLFYKVPPLIGDEFSYLFSVCVWLFYTLHYLARNCRNAKKALHA